MGINTRVGEAEVQTSNLGHPGFSLLKRGIVGTWHRVSVKYLAASLEEMTFRFNRRKNPNLDSENQALLDELSQVSSLLRDLLREMKGLRKDIQELSQEIGHLDRG